MRGPGAARAEARAGLRRASGGGGIDGTGVDCGARIAMDFRRTGVMAAILVAIAAPCAAADEIAAPAPVKPPAHAVKAKVKPKAAPDAGVAGVRFSDPDAPPVGVAQLPKPTLPPRTAGGPAEPQGGSSLGFKWHADNDHIDNPYLPPWVPNGQGYNVQAGLKVGF